MKSRKSQTQILNIDRQQKTRDIFADKQDPRVLTKDQTIPAENYKFLGNWSCN